MSGDKILLDTNAILYLLGGEISFLHILEGKDIFVSMISEMELLSNNNLTDNEIKSIRKFLDKCLIIDIFPTIKEHSILLRKKYHLKLPDAIIVATAYTFNIPFITADKKLFSIEEIDVVKITITK